MARKLLPSPRRSSVLPGDGPALALVVWAATLAL